VFTDISLKEINSLERAYLELIEYRLNIKGSEYAKYYFILRTAAERMNVKFPLKPINVDNVIELQKKAMKVKEHIKEQHTESRKTH